MKKLFTLPLLFALFLVLTSGTYRSDRPIEKYLALAQQPQFSGAGEILNFEDGKWGEQGSFVIIDSMTILSAAHCFIGEKTKDTVVNYKGQKVKTYVSLGRYQRNASEFRFFVMNMLVEAQKIILHPNYLKDQTCDIAIIKLKTPLHCAATLPINTATDELHDTVTSVGYGASGPANAAELVNAYQIKIAGQNIIDSIGGVLLNGQSTMLFSDFDRPDDQNACNRLGKATPLEMEYAIAGGDSGGPLYVYKNGKLCLAGIAAYAPTEINNLLKNGYYCGLSGWTRVSAFADWIRSNR